MRADKVKYVVIKSNGLEKVIVFSELLSHSVFGHLCPVSAGFVSFGEDGIDLIDGYRMLTAECYGESVALDIKSRPEEDVELIKAQILQSEEDLF